MREVGDGGEEGEAVFCEWGNGCGGVADHGDGEDGGGEGEEEKKGVGSMFEVHGFCF